MLTYNVYLYWQTNKKVWTAKNTVLFEETGLLVTYMLTMKPSVYHIFKPSQTFSRNPPDSKCLVISYVLA